MRIYIIIFLIFTANLFAQTNLKITVRDSLSKEALIGANILIKKTPMGATTGTDGVVYLKLRKGNDTLLVSYIGYKTKQITIFTDSINSSSTLTVLLTPSSIEEQPVIVTTSRISSHINKSPQRIEILGTEELQEKSFENPSNISELLSELSAVNVVQLSNLTGATNFRLLGLSGQYTQILKDGFPLFGGLSQDFGLTQIPPLDLAQIEIIKGASSAFYGNGAVAGIVNLISKEPIERSRGTLLLNATNYGGFDAGLFYSSKKNKISYTTLIQTDIKSPKDVNGDGFTEISRQRKFNIAPKLFWELDKSSLIKLGASFLHDEIKGGDLTAVNSSPSAHHPYILSSSSNRFTTTLDYKKSFENESTLNAKSGFSMFDLSIGLPGFTFDGKQTSTYSEINFNSNTQINQFTTGISLTTDAFHQSPNSSPYFDDVSNSQIALFAIDDYKLNDEFNFQIGMRLEKTNSFGTYLLPNVSLIYKPIDNFFVRLGYGTGYNIPTQISFLSEVEENYNNPTKIISPTNVEYSSSLTFDINYNLISSDKFYAKLDQTFFITEVKNPYQEVFDSGSENVLLFTQKDPLQSYGTESNFRLGTDDISFFVGLTYQRTIRKYFNDNWLPLTPDFKIISILQIENDQYWELDLGNIYNGNQYLNDGKKIKPYSTFEGLLKIKTGSFSFILNCEDIFNFRQSDREPIVIPPIQNPRFEEIWAPIEGRTLNLALIYDF